VTIYILGELNNEKLELHPNLSLSTNETDLTDLGLDLTEEDSMIQQSTDQSPMDSNTLANSRLISHLEESLEETRSGLVLRKRFRIHRVRRSLPSHEIS
jgi:hypothetical protein